MTSAQNLLDLKVKTLFVWDEIFRRIREYEVKTMWIVLNGEDTKYKVH